MRPPPLYWTLLLVGGLGGMLAVRIPEFGAVFWPLLVLVVVSSWATVLTDTIRRRRGHRP